MPSSNALTKVHSAVLIAIIVVAAVAGSSAYVLWFAKPQSAQVIRIGISGDIDMTRGKATLQGATLAAEQINSHGGILGRNVVIVAQDTDDETSGDAELVRNSLTRLITADKADFVITSTMGVGASYAFQDVCSEHKKIILSVSAPTDNLTMRVAGNYDRYKYYFRVGGLNSTAMSALMLDYSISVASLTGFKKVATLFQEGPTSTVMQSVLNKSLPKYGLEIVYPGHLPASVTDFTSYFAAIEEAGAEILIPGIVTQAGVPFVKEWHDRQSPVIVWGLLGLAQDSDFMELTEGKCDTVSFSGLPALAGYPLTNKSVATRDAIVNRWGQMPIGPAVSAYDIVRFILPDAVERAGTIETEAVIKALETTQVETSMARHFAFTANHDVLIELFGRDGKIPDHVVYCVFQWQNGKQVIMYPDQLRIEAGSVYKYPSWKGPWSG